MSVRVETLGEGKNVELHIHVEGDDSRYVRIDATSEGKKFVVRGEKACEDFLAACAKAPEEAPASEPAPEVSEESAE